ncbi:unnamed protein product, partial [Mycena citricolor]
PRASRIPLKSRSSSRRLPGWDTRCRPPFADPRGRCSRSCSQLRRRVVRNRALALRRKLCVLPRYRPPLPRLPDTQAASDPSCIVSTLVWVHGTYALLLNGSIVLT